MRIGRLTYRGLPLDGMLLDATLQHGGLVVRDFSIADFAGSRGAFTGSIANVDHDASIDGSLDVSVATLSRLVKALDIASGGPLPLESFTLSGAVNGNREELRFDQRLTALGGSLRAAGRLELQTAAPTVDTALELDHPNLSVLLGELLRDASVPRGLGPAALKGRLFAAAPDFRLSGLSGTAAGADLLDGDLRLSLAGPRPRLTADITARRLPPPPPAPVTPGPPPPPPPRQPVRIGGNVAEGNLISRVDPEYPLELREAGVEGTVVLEATVGVDGAVGEVDALTGPTGLRRAAVDAVSQWVYRPTLLNGRPVAVLLTVTVRFELS